MSIPRHLIRTGFTLIELLVTLGILATLVALLAPATQKVRAAATRIQCANNLWQLGLAAQHYEAVHERPVGETWAIDLLDYLEQQAVRALPPATRGVQQVASYRCPNHRADWFHELASGSYRMNALLIDPPIVPRDRSRIIFMDESDLPAAWSLNPRTFTINPHTTLHTNGINLLWADGHVTFTGHEAPPKTWAIFLDPFE